MWAIREVGRRYGGGELEWEVEKPEADEEKGSEWGGAFCTEGIGGGGGLFRHSCSGEIRIAGRMTVKVWLENEAANGC